MEPYAIALLALLAAAVAAVLFTVVMVVTVGRADEGVVDGREGRSEEDG